MSKDDYLELVEPWDSEEKGTLVETKIFSVRQRMCTSRTDARRKGLFYYLDGTDWVNSIAITPSEEVVLVEQYRHGLGEITLEIPGGMADPGEDPLVAGLRELREETGFTGGDSQVIGVVSPNPAIQTNRCHTILVPNAVAEFAPDPDEREELAVRLVPLSEIPALIQRGIIHHALVVAAFHHLSLR